MIIYNESNLYKFLYKCIYSSITLYDKIITKVILDAVSIVLVSRIYKRYWAMKLSPKQTRITCVILVVWPDLRARYFDRCRLASSLAIVW